MTRMLLSEDRTVVALDTNVLRDLCYAEPAWLGAFQDMAADGYEFCLADNVVAEIVDQFARLQ